MLVLSRKAGEKIMIGDNIEVQIQRVAGGRVTLAIEAPRDVRILRGELTPFENQQPASAINAPAMSQQPAIIRSFDPLRDTPMVS